MSSGPPSNQLAAFLAAIRSHESGGSYTAYNQAGGASGAYQFIQSTWSHWVTAAGFPQYAAQPAGAAPPSVQDAAAAAMASSYWAAYGGNWKDAAEAWYYPAWAGNPDYQNSVPYPSAGNTLTIGAYGDSIVGTMNQELGGTVPMGTNPPAGAQAVAGASAVGQKAVLAKDSFSPLSFAAGVAGPLFDPLGGLLGLNMDPTAGIGGIAQNIGTVAADFAKFSTVVLYGGTWIRFGEAVLGVITGAAGMTLLVMALAGGGSGSLGAASSVLSLIAGPEVGGVTKGIASDLSAGARAAGGSPNKAVRAINGGRANSARRSSQAAADSRARADDAQRRQRAAERHHTATRVREHQEYRRSLNMWEKSRQRSAEPDEGDELFERTRGSRTENRRHYRRTMDTRDMRRRTA